MGTITKLARTLTSGRRTPTSATTTRRAGMSRRRGTAPDAGVPRGVGGFVRRFLR